MARYTQDPGWKTLELLRQTGQSLGQNLQNIAEQPQKKRLAAQQEEMNQLNIDKARQELGAEDPWSPFLKNNPAFEELEPPQQQAIVTGLRSGDSSIRSKAYDRVLDLVELGKEKTAQNTMEQLKARYIEANDNAYRAQQSGQTDVAKDYSQEAERIKKQIKGLHEITLKQPAPSQYADRKKFFIKLNEAALSGKQVFTKVEAMEFKSMLDSESFNNELIKAALAGSKGFTKEAVDNMTKDQIKGLIDRYTLPDSIILPEAQDDLTGGTGLEQDQRPGQEVPPKKKKSFDDLGR